MVVLAGAGAGAWIATASADDPSYAAELVSFASAVDVDPDLVVSRLEGESFAERWGAVRLAPQADGEPSALLAPLVRLAGSRDHRIAPEAAFSAFEIASRLDPQELDAEELDRAALRELAEPYAALAADESARADVRLLAGQVAAALSSL